MATVVLDAGHGGYDAGASNSGRLEKNDNLMMTLAVGDILRSCGVNITYTRTTDTFIPLSERSNIGNRVNPDLFVSFHRNSSENPEAYGVETFVYTSPSAKSISAANAVQNRLTASSGMASRGVSRDNFSVLRQTRAPAILIELGFISNTRDNALFDQNFTANANAVAQGILSALGVSCGTPPPSGGGGSRATVRSIQSSLNSLYGSGLAVDGIFGPATAQAVRSFQSSRGLAADGLAGPNTFQALMT